MEKTPFQVLFLEEASDLLEVWEASFMAVEDQISNMDQWHSLFRVAHTMKGSSKSVGFNDLGDYIHKIEDVLTVIKNDYKKASPHVLKVLNDSYELIRLWVDFYNDNANEKPSIAQNLIDLQNCFQSDINVSKISHSQKEVSSQEFQEIEGTKKSQNIDFSEHSKKTSVQNSSSTNKVLRIQAEKIDRLMQVIGEISTQASIVFHYNQKKDLGSLKCQQSLALLQENLPMLRDLAMGLRLEALDRFFQRMQKIARDTAKSLDKKIEVNIQGEEIELDKSIVDRIVDPFIHIVRNAVDHGLENPQDRIRSKKNESGQLTLKAEAHGSYVEISVKEDGRGMDPKKLMEAAMKKGIISKPDLTDEQAYELILKPGFSTAEKVTDVSGRGVGMDVVNSTIRELGGKLKIISHLGHGSEFIISLPTSIAIVESFVVENGKELYVIPRNDVDEVIDLSVFTIKNSKQTSRVIDFQNALIPVVHLGNFFAKEYNGSKGKQAFLISLEQKKIAFEVDNIKWQQEIVTRSMKGSLKKMRGVSGFTILADGEPSLILSLKELANDFFSRNAA